MKDAANSMEPLHPATGDELSEIERTMWRFRMVSHEASVMWRGLTASGDAANAINSDLWFSLTNQALILVCKFLEVWDHTSSLAKIDDRIAPMRRAVQPIIDRIRIWRGLGTFRNTSLAHSYLDQENRLLPPWELGSRQLVPTYDAEVILLLQLIVFGSLAAMSPFEAEYAQIDILAGPRGKPQPPAAPGIERGTEIEAEARSVTAPVSAALKDTFNVDFKSPLFDAFKRALVPRAPRKDAERDA